MQIIKKEGFSLLELTIVTLIMALFMSLALPTFTNFTDSAPMTAAKRLAGQIRLLRINAITKGNRILLRINPQEKEYSFFILNHGERTPHPKYKEAIKIPQSVTIGQLNLGQRNKTLISEKDPIDIFIDPLGFVDLFSIDLMDEKIRVNLQVINLIGKIRITHELIQ